MLAKAKGAGYTQLENAPTDDQLMAYQSTGPSNLQAQISRLALTTVMQTHWGGALPLPPK
jgi:hypothetical protein